MQRPSLKSVFLGLVPFAAICFAVPLWDRIHPIVFGLPFNCFWLILWILITPLNMWVAYRVERRREDGVAPRGRKGER